MEIYRCNSDAIPVVFQVQPSGCCACMSVYTWTMHKTSGYLLVILSAHSSRFSWSPTTPPPVYDYVVTEKFNPTESQSSKTVLSLSFMSECGASTFAVISSPLGNPSKGIQPSKLIYINCLQDDLFIAIVFVVLVVVLVGGRHLSSSKSLYLCERMNALLETLHDDPSQTHCPFPVKILTKQYATTEPEETK